MTSGKTLQDCKHCAQNCPFLEINYFEASQKIPYHCELFNSFLGFDGNVLRCSECMGEQRSIKEEGLNFINAFYDRQINKSITKISFIKLLPNLQSQFVSFIKRFGKPVGVPTYIDFSKKMGIDKLQKLLLQEIARQNNQAKYASKEKEDIEYILKKQTDSFPGEMDSEMTKLILSLFAVLDSSERAVLLQILKNPNTLMQFLQKLRFMKKDKNFVASVRLEMEQLLPQATLENISQDNAKAAMLIQQIEKQNVKS